MHTWIEHPFHLQTMKCLDQGIAFIGLSDSSDVSNIHFLTLIGSKVSCKPDRISFQVFDAITEFSDFYSQFSKLAPNLELLQI